MQWRKPVRVFAFFYSHIQEAPSTMENPLTGFLGRVNMYGRSLMFVLSTAVVLGGLAALARAQPLGSSVVPTIDHPNRYAVSGVEAARRVFELATMRRIDIALIADSNGRVGAAASGHEDAMGRAYCARFGMYATRVDPGGSVAAWGADTCSQWSGLYSYFTSDPPEGFANYAFPSISFPSACGVLAAGADLPSNFNWGLTLEVGNPIDISSNLRYHLTQASFGPGTGGFLNVSAREAYPGNIWHNYAVTPTISTEGDGPGLFDIALTVPAGQRPMGIHFAPVNTGDGLGSHGPLALFWQRVENTDRTHGVAYGGIWEEGGRSARYTLNSVLTGDVQDPITEWFRQVTRLQNDVPVLLIHIMHGGNDIIDTNPSLGPIGGLISNTGPGHEDNIRGIINLLRTWWVQSGRDPANLYFQLGPYHPRPGDDNPIQLAFEQAWRNIAASDPQVFAVAGNMLSTPEEFATRGFLLNGDPYHLSYQGFQAWAPTMIRAIDLALCPAEYNGDHVLSVDDIFAFLNDWFAGNVNTDFDYSGTLEVQDIFEFLNSWFTGCPG
jgi:hypothetical protein